MSVTRGARSSAFPSRTGLLVAAVLAGVGAAWPTLAPGQSCPEAGTSLSIVRNVINDLGKSDRAPAAADCALRWSSTVQLDADRLRDLNLLSFFQEAADLHRRAYEKRQAAGRTADADKYLGDEIVLRRRFLEAALQSQEVSTDEALRRATVRHLSALTGALARRQQFAEVDKVLANADASVIDEAAVNVWLQALWSCAKFDGKSTNLCTPDNQRECRDPVSGFLASVDDMKGRRFPPQTRRDIGRLRTLTTEGGCLR